MNNILLVVVDCMRRDYAFDRDKMPKLATWGSEKATMYTNFWAVSHCTDPTMTCLLSGRHPDEIGLYTMMFEQQDWTIGEEVIMLPQIAKDLGYTTAMLSNNGRWYRRGVDHYVNVRGWPDEKTVVDCGKKMQSLDAPWFITCHLTGMHTHYMGGSYATAAKIEDGYVKSLIDTVATLGGDTNIMITADHGEGLGDHGIAQHGHGLYPELTHIPLMVYEAGQGQPRIDNRLFDQQSAATMLWKWMKGKSARAAPKKYVYQVGDTPPSTRHYGIVYPDKTQYIIGIVGDRQFTFYVPDEASVVGKEPDPLELIKGEHERYGHSAADLLDPLPEEVLKRLKGLGYFE